jgi:hypothetical protein
MRVFTRRACTTLDDGKVRLKVVVKRTSSPPERLPARVVDLAT